MWHVLSGLVALNLTLLSVQSQETSELYIFLIYVKKFIKEHVSWNIGGYLTSNVTVPTQFLTVLVL